MLIFISIIAIIIAFFLWSKLKIPKCGNMTLVTGGIKTGKSAMSVRLAYRTYKRNLLKTHIWNAIQHIRFKKNRSFKELPKLYSNIPLRCDYVPLTNELLKRQTRFAYGSVCYICECSLVACSMDYKDDDLNENLLLLNKLFAHETKGGSIFYDTQSISDNHYAIKRCLATYFYIHHNIKIPFIALICWVKELKYSDDGNNVNINTSDVEDDLRMVVIPWRTFKLYDRYCYSVLTDHLKVEDKEVKRTYKDKHNKKLNLKANKIITFKKNKKYYEMESEKNVKQ
jgi:hypothetical protein